MISLSAAVTVLVYLLVAGLIFSLFWWGLHRLNPPQPFLKVGEVVIIILAVLVLISVLMSLVGRGPVTLF